MYFVELQNYPFNISCTHLSAPAACLARRRSYILHTYKFILHVGIHVIFLHVNLVACEFEF